MTKKIITTYTEYDEDGKIKSQFAPVLLSLLKTLELMGSGSFSRQTWIHLVTRRRLKNEQSR